MILLDIAFYSETGLHSSGDILGKHHGTWEHFKFMPPGCEIHVLKFGLVEEDLLQEKIHFYFRKAVNSTERLNEICRILKVLNPDFVISHSFNFPLQTIILKSFLAPGCKLIVQHHSELPYRPGLKRRIQEIAYRKADAYFFVSEKQARLFDAAGTVPVFEIMEGSCTFSSGVKKGYQSATPVFLWVGRLVERKDPVTVVNAFASLKKRGLNFKLHMIYSDDNMIMEIKTLIDKNDLNEYVSLEGKIDHREMKDWYRRADYFISTSLHEGSNWSLCEAMACGCVPVVSDIPSHKKMAEGGLFFNPGDFEQLASVISDLDETEFAQRSESAFGQYKRFLSFDAIASHTHKALQLMKKGH